MSFLHPEFLYYMLPPLIILFGFLLTQKEAQLHFFSDEVISKLRVSANILTLKARNALFFLMGIFIIIALAHPVINEGEIEVKAKSADIMIALDISDSMLAEDVYPNRLKSAKQKAMDLLKIAPNERIGVIAFAKNSYLVSPLSFDHSAVGFLLRQLDTNSITEKGTDFLSMLEVVDKSVDKDAKKYLLILSDGGDENDFSKEIAYAKEKNIVVFILGIGTQKGAPIKLEDGSFIKYKDEILVSKLNEKSADLATKSGGVYIQSVKSDDDIKAMLKEIESLSEEKELKSEKVQRYIPLFYYPLGIALFLFLIATSSMSKRESVHVPSLFILFTLLFATPHAKAGLLDFMELEEAKKAYENKEYEKASSLYAKHANNTLNAQSYYNAGNALYNQNKYDEALESYEKATFGDKSQTAKKLANMGNSYVKQAKEGSLQKAVASYEESLKMSEDKDVRENLEAVKKLLEQQKQEQNKNEDSKEQENQQNNDKSSKEQENQQNKDKNSKEEENKQNKDENSKEQEKKSNQENQGDDSTEKEKNKENQKESDAQEKKSDENQSKQESEPKQNQDVKESKNEASQNKMGSSKAEEQMSDAQEQKWLEQLNSQPNTYMYMLNDKKSKMENTNEKPW